MWNGKIETILDIEKSSLATTKNLSSFQWGRTNELSSTLLKYNRERRTEPLKSIYIRENSISSKLTYAQILFVHRLVSDPIDVLQLRSLGSHRSDIRRSLVRIPADVTHTHTHTPIVDFSTYRQISNSP